MKPEIIKAINLKETFTSERCFIAENCRSSDGKVSVARARVKAGVTTISHHLNEIDEIYIITKGAGIVQFENLEPTQVTAGDVVYIPAGASQKITNTGKSDLIFYCVCTPCFNQECYVDDEKTGSAKKQVADF